MKKLFYILLLTILTLIANSCGNVEDDEPILELDDWYDNRNPDYKPESYSPLFGEWLELGTTKPTVKIICTKDFEDKNLYLGNSEN